MRFYDVSQVTKLSLGPLPSVTQVLAQTYNRGRYGALVPGSSYAQNVKYRADVGTAVHSLAEAFFLGQEAELDSVYENVVYEAQCLFKQVEPILNGLRIYRGPSGKLAIEKVVFSARLMVAGRVDFVVEAPDGSLEVWDLKTAGSKRKADQIKGYFLQTAAYAQCISEMSGRPVSACRLLFVYAARDESRSLSPYTEEISMSGAAIDVAKAEFARYRDEFQRLCLPADTSAEALPVGM